MCLLAYTVETFTFSSLLINADTFYQSLTCEFYIVNETFHFCRSKPSLQSLKNSCEDTVHSYVQLT
jgi:hypothetical protein